MQEEQYIHPPTQPCRARRASRQKRRPTSLGSHVSSLVEIICSRLNSYATQWRSLRTLNPLLVSALVHTTPIIITLDSQKGLRRGGELGAV